MATDTATTPVSGTGLAGGLAAVRRWTQDHHPAYRPTRGATHRRWNEKSNSFAMFVFILPIIIGAFGLGVDVTRNIYIRTSLQNALDMATVGGAGVTRIATGGQVVINDAPAQAALERLYAVNRADGPFAGCMTASPTTVPGTGISKCWRTLGGSRQPVFADDYVFYAVRERTKNAFLPVLGIENLRYQYYTLESTAVLRQTTR